MWCFERDDLDDQIDHKIGCRKMIVIIFWPADRFHVIESLSDAYHFNSHYFCNIIFPDWTKECHDFASSTKICHDWFMHVTSTIPVIAPLGLSSQNWKVMTMNKCFVFHILRTWSFLIFSVGCINTRLVDRQHEIEEKVLKHVRDVMHSISVRYLN
jgi:hypothetical protein